MSRTSRLFSVVAGVAVWASTVTPILATSTPPVPLETRAQGADGVVVASIERVATTYQRNKYGDELIVSHAQLVIREVLKGRDLAAGERVFLDVEGGTVGEITLRVSDLPSVAPGERAVFFLHRDANGRFVPHLRGLGILKLDSADHVIGSSASLDDVRSRVYER